MRRTEGDMYNAAARHIVEAGIRSELFAPVW